MKWPLVGLLVCFCVIGAAIFRVRSAHPHPSTFTLSVEPLAAPWTQIHAAVTQDARHRALIWPRDRFSPSELSIFDPATGTFDNIEILGTPPEGTIIPSLACDTLHSVLYLFGGWSPNGVRPCDDLFSFDLTSAVPTWKRFPRSQPWPPGRNGAGMAYDPQRNRLIVLTGDGGLDSGGGFHPLDDVWQFDVTRGVWSAIPSSDRAPSARWHAMVAIDTVGQKLYLIGGAGLSTTSFDRALYELDLTTDRWRRTDPSGDWPPSMQGATLTVDPIAHALVLAGGLCHQPPGPATSSNVWVFDLNARTWQRLDGGEMLRRRDHVAIYDPATASHYLLGGQISKKIGNFYERGETRDIPVRLRLKPAVASR